MDTFADDRELLERLVQLPGETLNVEIKAWLDPKQVLDAAKIIKACFALRNRNGGPSFLDRFRPAKFMIADAMTRRWPGCSKERARQGPSSSPGNDGSAFHTP